MGRIPSIKKTSQYKKLNRDGLEQSGSGVLEIDGGLDMSVVSGPLSVVIKA